VIDHEFLYRALRPDEIKRRVLIPKSCGPFIDSPRFPQVFPFAFGERTEHAVRAQQWDGQYPTSGVSTTPDLKRAEYYAQHDRTIASIAVDRLEACGIKTFRVSEHVHHSLIFKPEDDEVILVCPGGECFPSDIIADIFKLPGRDDC
jgi:hypothetical protein